MFDVFFQNLRRLVAILQAPWHKLALHHSSGIELNMRYTYTAQQADVARGSVHLHFLRSGNITFHSLAPTIRHFKDHTECQHLGKVLDMKSPRKIQTKL